ncbi:MAG: hypothetical protein P1U46_04005 [Patescibacteria group bacterium]|nr:hypothetical protein [Patescibacteria group bacterium]
MKTKIDKIDKFKINSNKELLNLINYLDSKLIYSLSKIENKETIDEINSIYSQLDNNRIQVFNNQWIIDF